MYLALPLTNMWDTWISKNKAIFKNKYPLISMNLHRSKSTNYFCNGESSGNPGKCGLVGFITNKYRNIPFQ